MTVHHGTQNSSGFSLLEVLIALLVLAVGLLGVAALQNFSFKFNNQSYERSQATLLIYDMIDRMRANPKGIANNSYKLDPATNVIPAAGDCLTSACTPAQMAAFDIMEWMTAMQEKAVLVNPLARINQVASPVTSLYEVSITWTETNPSIATVTQTVTVELQ